MFFYLITLKLISSHPPWHNSILLHYLIVELVLKFANSYNVDIHSVSNGGLSVATPPPSSNYPLPRRGLTSSLFNPVNLQNSKFGGSEIPVNILEATEKYFSLNQITESSKFKNANSMPNKLGKDMGQINFMTRAFNDVCRTERNGNYRVSNC